MIRINNLPEYANEYKWIVVTADCTGTGELWFYGAYELEVVAVKVANEIDGLIVINA